VIITSTNVTPLVGTFVRRVAPMMAKIYPAKSEIVFVKTFEEALAQPAGT
jgi:hypothetical protein